MPCCATVSVNTPFNKSLQHNHNETLYVLAWDWSPSRLIHQNESNTFCKLFLLKWIFLWLQMLSVALNTGVKPTKPTLPIGWLWFNVHAFQVHNLISKLTTQTHQLHYPASRTSFFDTITSSRKQPFYWNWATLPFQSPPLQSPKFNLDELT